MDPLVETVEEGCATWRSDHDALQTAMDRNLLWSSVETNNGELGMPLMTVSGTCKLLPPSTTWTVCHAS
jgi:hypothetical protein